MQNAKEFYLPFLKKERVAKDTYSFYFDRSKVDFSANGGPASGWSFLPGQYVRITLDIKNPDNRGNSHSFTIASSPLERKYIMITTKIIKSQAPDGAWKSSFKKRLAELTNGEKVKFFGPMGGFVLNEEENDSRVFLAGGIGITPFHSMITYANAKNLLIPITLLVSFSTVEETIFYKELSAIASKNPYIKIIYTISHTDKSFKNSFRHSRESGNPIPKSRLMNDNFEIASDGSRKSWNGETGRISEELIKKYVSNILESQYFIVGSPAMVAAMEEAVGDIGVPSEKIFIENFTGY